MNTQFRIDQSFTDKFKMFASLALGNVHQPYNNFNITYAPYDQYQIIAYTPENTGVVGFTYTIKPTVISETRVGEYRRTGNNGTKAGTNYQFAIAKTVPQSFRQRVCQCDWLRAGDRRLQRQQPARSGHPDRAANNNHQLNEDFTWVKGTHAFKFGYEWLWENEVSHNISNPRLSLTFDTANGIRPTGVTTPNTGITFAGLEWATSTVMATPSRGRACFQWTQTRAFISRTLAHPSKLTLNLGIRSRARDPGA